MKLSEKQLSFVKWCFSPSRYYVTLLLLFLAADLLLEQAGLLPAKLSVPFSLVEILLFGTVLFVEGIHFSVFLQKQTVYFSLPLIVPGLARIFYCQYDSFVPIHYPVWLTISAVQLFELVVMLLLYWKKGRSPTVLKQAQFLFLSIFITGRLYFFLRVP